MRKILIVVILAAAAMALFFTPGAAVGPTFSGAILFGGAGDQRGSSIAISGSDLYVAGTNGGTGIVVKYGVAPTTPVWNASGSSNTYYGAVALSPTTVYGVGSALPPSCGASDGVGDTEGKPSISRFTTAGVLSGCQSTNHFPYRGGETDHAAITTVEGGNTFLYTTGLHENCGFGHHVFVLAKYDAAGAPVNKVTEPGVSFGGFNCVGGSFMLGMREYNGHVYLAGTSNLSGLGEDGGPGTGLTRPVLMKYDMALNRVWKQRPSDYAAGVFRAVTESGGAIYAVGYAYTPNVANSQDYLIEKYDEAGVRQWSKISGGAANEELGGVVGIGGRLYAVGYTRSTGAGGADASILEIDPATGNTISTTLHGGAQDDLANGAATDGIDLYVVGETRSFATPEGNVVGQNDLMLIRYTDTTSPCTDKLQFTTRSQIVAEGIGAATVGVVRSGTNCTNPIAVSYATSNNTATAGADYASASGRIRFDPGETTKTFLLPIVSDLSFEGNESINLTLSSPAGGVLGQRRTMIVTITDNETIPTLQFSADTYTGSESPPAGTVKVTRTGDTTGTVGVTISTGNNTATAGSDYTALSMPLTFNPGETSKLVNITILPDPAVEGLESLNVTLSTPTGGAVLGGKPRTVLFIIDDEVP